MGSVSSKITQGLGRALKMFIVAVLLPLPIGLLTGVVEQFEAIQVAGGNAWHLVYSGFLTYAGCHVLLYRPVGLFRAGQWIFSTLAVWLFGGQVSTTDNTAGGGQGKGGRKPKAPKSDGAAYGSPLVAFSPYVIPVYLVLACAVAWLAARVVQRRWVDGPAAVLIGVTTAFHWLMTADDLQPQRERWHVETYLLAIGLVFLLTLLIGAACVWWALPDFSYYQALRDGWAASLRIYQAATRQLFF
ncbi:MAG: hypothetical protein HY598_01370 [Candidatus Omnitrophica bacterium]|nr:hypothetical protein [Candidatus Omnitrophota bacterium]